LRGATHKQQAGRRINFGIHLNQVYAERAAPQSGFFTKGGMVMKNGCYLVVAVVLLTAAATTVQGQAATLTPMEQLGKSLFFDKISEPSSMSCAACHAPRTGFTGPIPAINRGGSVYRGAVPQRFGNRRPPAASYATFSPIFHFDGDEGLFIGGNFWDGRATGEKLGNPAADQALGPFLNPVEQNNPSKRAVLEKVAGSKYAGLWEEVWGEPISYETEADVEMNYDRIGLAIAAYESSEEVNQFSSKFDVFWENALEAGLDVSAINMANWQAYTDLGLADSETEGLAVFNDEDKGKCALCHVLDPVIDKHGVERPPVFTDFSFDNLGVPKNPDNPFYGMDKVYLDGGSPINPEGADWVDPGLGGFLTTRPEWEAMAEENLGKHKVPTLRNVDKRPGAVFPKSYMHNGVLKSLEEVVHFYNTRDVEDWPPPEVSQNVNTDELGDLGLTIEEENLIVAFMRTLSDGYKMGGESMEMVGAKAVSLDLAGPNPIGPSTGIRFFITTPGRVQVHLFNVNGQRVAALFDGWRDAGEHTVGIDADGLSSGVYFVNIAGGNQTLTKKLVLLRQ
jgi:cytochrome c peroxidase